MLNVGELATWVGFKRERIRIMRVLSFWKVGELWQTEVERKNCGGRYFNDLLRLRVTLKD